MLQEALDHHNRGAFTEAIAGYRRVLASSPNQAEALHYFGVALAQTGDYAQALDPLSRALERRPDSAVLHNHYGNALAGLSRYAEALNSYERSIACDSNLADCHYNRGVAFMELGQQEAALACYTQTIELDPGYAQAHNNRGNVLADCGQTMHALQSYDAAIRARPQFVDAWINRTHLLRRLHRYEEALDSSQRAVLSGPRHPEAHNSRGATLADMGRYEEALTSYERALELNPALAEAAWNKGLIKLVHGDFHNGWRLYESRWGVKSLKLPRRFPEKPRWRGVEPISGKVVLLHAEQGYGDTIQFSRYCAKVAALGARVLLSAPMGLRSLLSSAPGVYEVIVQGAAPAFDFHCSLMSLPLAFGTELSDIPVSARYLRAEQSAIARWADRLAGRPQVPRVGLVWSGRPTHNNDLNRSIPLQELIPVTRCELNWISLQKEVRTADDPCLTSTPAVLRLGEELTDFADAAALIENLDLVVTVDTAMAHLAGALGKPVWILLPYVADWRWLQNRDDSPWYPSARLFRQSARVDWAQVIERLVAELNILFKIQSIAAPPKREGANGQSRSRARQQ
jgi:tetratricopeptide (TPR) repeat protein